MKKNKRVDKSGSAMLAVRTVVVSMSYRVDERKCEGNVSKESSCLDQVVTQVGTSVKTHTDLSSQLVHLPHINYSLTKDLSSYKHTDIFFLAHR